MTLKIILNLMIMAINFKALANTFTFEEEKFELKSMFFKKYIKSNQYIFHIFLKFQIFGPVQFREELRHSSIQIFSCT
jgi:hypothetical protein